MNSYKIWAKNVEKKKRKILVPFIWLLIISACVYLINKLGII